MTTTFAMNQDRFVLEEESAWDKTVRVAANIIVPVGVTAFWGAVVTLDVFLVLESIAMGGIIGWACAVVWAGFGLLGLGILFSYYGRYHWI